MSSSAYYREEAPLLRSGSNTHDPGMAERWRAIALEYDQLADAMADAPVRLHPNAGAQPQPMQQQLSKTKEDK
jgi:hypothetical protein